MWKNRDSTLFCFINESKQYHFVTKREIYIYTRTKLEFSFPFLKRQSMIFFFFQNLQLRDILKF